MYMGISTLDLTNSDPSPSGNMEVQWMLKYRRVFFPEGMRAVIVTAATLSPCIRGRRVVEIEFLMGIMVEEIYETR